MESKRKETAKTGETIIITVEELERRKDRFRKATRDYYEHAEKGFRILHGFCNRNNDKFYKKKLLELQDENEPPGRRKRKRGCSKERLVPSLRRCRQRLKRTSKIPGLEADLAQRLLESHYSIVEIAMSDYLFAIRNLIRPSPSLLPRLEPASEEHYQHGNRSNISLLERDGVLLRVPTVVLPLPLPIAFDTSDESVERRLKRHCQEVTEEEHVAMASFMTALRESKTTKDLAKKIYEGTQSIRTSLNKVSSLIEANRHNTYFCFHYDCFPSDSEQATIFKPSAILKGGADRGQQTWDQEVADARVLDGYFRWFRENNGVLLVQNSQHHDNDDVLPKQQNEELLVGSEILVESESCSCRPVLRNTKRPRKVSVDEEQRRMLL